MAMMRALLRLCLLALLLASAAIAAGHALPGGGEIAFTVYNGVNPDIYRLDILHHLRVNLTRGDPFYDAGAAWSPDGRWIAFNSNREGPLSIYLMDSLGQNVRPLAPLQGASVGTRWSADGQYIYIFRRTGQDTEIFRVRVDGSEYEQILDVDEAQSIRRDLDVDLGNLNGTFSPDGEHMLFIAYREGSWGIYLTAGGRREGQRLADAGMQYTDPPVWSRDGQQIAYIARMAEGYDVYVIDARPGQALPRRLTFDAAVETSVSWRP
jgi:TolB protein